MKKLLTALLITIGCSASSQVQYLPTSYANTFVQTINNAAAARAYLGIVTGLTNYGETVTNWTMYGTTLLGSTTNGSLTASRAMVTDANRVTTSSATTATEIGYVSGVTSALQTQLDSKPPTTNTVTLTGTQTIAGTKTFPTSLFTANNIGVRLLWSSPTNIYIPSMVASAALTNNGDWAATTTLLSVTIPVLLGSNSTLAISYGASRTNANATAGNVNYYVGTNTNFVASVSTFGTTVGAVSQPLLGLFQNAASFTSQLQGLGAVVIPSLTNFVDTSSAFSLYVGAMTTTTHTNAHLIGFRVYEIYAP